MKVKFLKKLPAVEVTIRGDWENGNYISKSDSYASEDDFNEDLYLFVIYLDFYDKYNNDPNYVQFDASEYDDLNKALVFYFKNEHQITLDQNIFDEFVAIMTNDIIPFSSYLGYSIISGPEDIEIKIGLNNAIYNIDYNEEDVKSAIDKLMKEQL